MKIDARNIAIGLMIFAVIAAAMPAAFAAPQLPHLFYGTATINGADAPIGTVIIAMVDGVERGRITVTEAGKYGGPTANENKLLVQGDDLSDGDTITFTTNENTAEQTAIFESGAVDELDLTWTIASPPPLVPPAPSGGGGGITSARLQVSSPESTSVDAGSSVTINVVVNNIGGTTAANIALSVSGVSANWVTSVVSASANIVAGGSQTYVVIITVPAGEVARTEELTFTATTGAVSSSSDTDLVISVPGTTAGGTTGGEVTGAEETGGEGNEGGEEGTPGGEGITGEITGGETGSTGSGLTGFITANSGTIIIIIIIILVVGFVVFKFILPKIFGK